MLGSSCLPTPDPHPHAQSTPPFQVLTSHGGAVLMSRPVHLGSETPSTGHSFLQKLVCETWIIYHQERGVVLRGCPPSQPS